MNNPFMKMLSGLKVYMYEAMKSGNRYKNEKLDQPNAVKSKRAMKMQRGSQPQYIGIRRFERNATVHRKCFKPSLRVSV